MLQIAADVAEAELLVHRAATGGPGAGSGHAQNRHRPPTGPGEDDVREQCDAVLAAADAVVVDLADHSRPVLAAARARGRTVWCDLHNYDGRSAFHTEFRDAADMLFVRSPDLAAPDAGGTGA